MLEFVILAFYLIIYALLYGAIIALSIASYVLQAIALQSIAKRRGFSKPWLSWIPVANIWLLGAIADEYDSRAGISKNYGKKTVITYVASLVIIFSGIIFMYAGIIISGVIGLPEEFMMIIILLSFAVCIVGFVPLGFYCAFYYISLFKVFRSTAGGMAILYFMLSMFVSYALPVCLFICRKKGYDVTKIDIIEPLDIE